jgi:hypothetical protein
MKKNISTIVLIVEIASIVLLHAAKIRQTQQAQFINVDSSFSYLKQDLQLKPLFSVKK